MAQVIKAAVESTPCRVNVGTPSQLLLDLASSVEQSMGGSSGGLYSLFFAAASTPLIAATDAQAWCDALGAGIQAISKYGHASPGDRTMLDALHPAHVELSKSLASGTAPIDAMGVAASASEEGALKTAQMKAKAGRASYVEAGLVDQSDPGAHAVGVWMRALYDACKNFSGGS